MAFIEKHVKKFLQTKPPNSDELPVKLFFQSQMSENYKQDEQQLVKLLKKKNVRPVNENSNLKIPIFYKNRKLKNLFIRNVSAYFNRNNVSDKIP